MKKQEQEYSAQVLISQRLSALEDTKLQLKGRFFGIDQVIDQVIAAMAAWYAFPSAIKNPVIINLWGMTGVGKTALVHSLIDMLKWNEQSFFFDCGELQLKGAGIIENRLSALLGDSSMEAPILVFDEFQYARSISQNGEDIRFPESRALWKILDHGTLSLQEDWFFREKRVQDLILELRYWLRQGVQIENGLIAEKERNFLATKYRSIQKQFQPKEWLQHIRNPEHRLVFNEEELLLLEEVSRFKHGDRYALLSKIKGMTGEEILNFLEDLNTEIGKPSIIDCSRALVFVIGNLDDLYFDANNLSPDYSADMFHASSLKFTVPDVKKALQRSFRNEQIARLGNHHILYPALSAEAYRQYIACELNKLSDWMKEQAGWKVTFHQGVAEWIFKEGVVPAQGMRPVRSTIRYGIKNQLPRVLLDFSTFSVAVDSLHFHYENKFLHVKGMGEGQVYGQKAYALAEVMHHLKASRNDDLQAITAVHESGHAVVLMGCMGKLPNRINSVASASGVCGSVDYQSEKLISPKTMKERIAVMLAGFEAECLIFGHENVTNGSVSDLQMATELVVSLLKTAGFGQELVCFSSTIMEYGDAIHDFHSVEKEVRNIIADAKIIASEILDREKTLLLALSRYLAQEPDLSRDELERYVSTYGTDAIQTKLRAKEPSYRQWLMDASAHLGL